MYTSSEDMTVKLWDLSASGCARDFKHSSSVTCATLHPNQAEIIVGLQDGTIRVIDLTAGKTSCILSMSDDESAIRSVAASNDGKWLVGVNNEGICTAYEMPQRDSSVMDKKKSWKAHSTYILKTAFSPNGKTLATSSADETVKIWTVGDWGEEKTLTGHTQWVWDCTFSADSAYLLTGSSDKTARLWDLAQGETVRVYQGHAKSIVCVALNDLSDVA
jgi:G protein beta subunit-like protein